MNTTGEQFQLSHFLLFPRHPTSAALLENSVRHLRSSRGCLFRFSKSPQVCCLFSFHRYLKDWERQGLITNPRQTATDRAPSLSVGRIQALSLWQDALQAATTSITAVSAARSKLMASRRAGCSTGLEYTFPTRLVLRLSLQGISDQDLFNFTSLHLKTVANYPQESKRP
jgi:hypothetical protein